MLLAQRVPPTAANLDVADEPRTWLLDGELAGDQVLGWKTAPAGHRRAFVGARLAGLGQRCSSGDGRAVERRNFGYAVVVAETLEDGDLYVLYRPRVEEQQVESLDDVQRLLMVLHPWRGRRALRLLVVGKKQLPEIEERERFWGFVDTVVERPEQLRETLDGRAYETRTRGERRQQPARPVAEGAYVIARHDDHTHLAYQLEMPRRFGEAQQELNIEPEASYVVSVKNPQAPSPREARRPESEKPDLPSDLQGRFRNRRFISLDPPEFLDHPGTELLLIGARHDASEELQINLDAEVERAARDSIFDDLRIGREERPVEPLFQGEWR